LVSRRKENFSTLPFDYCSLSPIIAPAPWSQTPSHLCSSCKTPVESIWYITIILNFLLSRSSLEGKIIQMCIKHFYISSLRNEIRTYAKNSNMPNVSSKVFRELNKIKFVNEYDVCIQMYIVLSWNWRCECSPLNFEVWCVLSKWTLQWVYLGKQHHNSKLMGLLSHSQIEEIAVYVWVQI
jgi:hypothetical protein